MERAGRQRYSEGIRVVWKIITPIQKWWQSSLDHSIYVCSLRGPQDSCGLAAHRCVSPEQMQLQPSLRGKLRRNKGAGFFRCLTCFTHNVSSLDDVSRYRSNDAAPVRRICMQQLSIDEMFAPAVGADCESWPRSPRFNLGLLIRAPPPKWMKNGG